MIPHAPEENLLICKIPPIIVTHTIFSKLLKFRGKDLGKSKFEIERGVN